MKLNDFSFRSKEEEKREEEIQGKLSEIFGKSSNIEQKDKKPDKFVKVGVDHDGNDIIVNTNPSGGLQIAPEIMEKIRNPDWLKHNREAAKEKRKKLLDAWFDGRSNGMIAEDFEGQKNDLFDIPKEFVHMLVEVEDDDDELDQRSKQIIKNARANSTVVEPDLMKGLVDSIDSGAGYKNAIWVTDFLKYLKQRNVNFSLLKNDMAAVKALYDEWHALKRPSIPVIMQRLIQECDELFFKWLETEKAQNLDPEVRKLLKTDIGTRVEFLHEMAAESGEQLYTIEDFILLKFQFQEYGLHQEDQEWFDRNKPIPSREGITMGNYLDEFKVRTGWDFADVFYHYWKEVEKENEEKTKNEMQDELGNKSLVEGKENEHNMLVSDKPDSVSRVTINSSVHEIYEYDDDDII